LARSLFASFLLLLAGAAFAADPKIEHLNAAASSGQVSVRFSLSHLFDRDEMLQALQSGVPTGITYVVEIYRDRPNWFDEGIARARLEVIATFNSVTREYLLNCRRDRRLVRSETSSDLGALQRRMTSIDEVNLFDIGTRRPYKLKVRAKADLTKGWLFYVIPWDTSTHWTSVRVKSDTP